MFDFTGGRVGGQAFEMPVVKLTTTGRKSSRRRSAMLTSPIHDNENVVLVAS